MIHIQISIPSGTFSNYCVKCSRKLVDSSSLQWAVAEAGKYSPRRKHVREHAVIRRSVVRMRSGGQW